MLHPCNIPQTPRRQRGAILVVSLLLLLVMTLLGLAAMQVSRMEERMAGNSRDINLAFQGAEAGLRDAENRIQLMTARPNPCITAACGLWQRNILPDNLRDQAQGWWTANAVEYGALGSQQILDVSRDPLSISEDMGFVPDSLTLGHGPPEGRNFYRITTNSTGGTDTAQAVLESTYTRRF